MRLKPIVDNVLYAIAAQRLGQLHPRIALVMDARNGPMFVQV